MKIKKPFFFVIILSSNLYVNAHIFQIAGKVVGEQNTPIEFAEVLLLQNADVAQFAMTDSAGVFTVSAGTGTYRLLIKQLGDTLYYQHITVFENLNLGEISVTNSSKLLQEVTVTARKKLIERRTDRLVFYVENSISSTGGTALDVLKITPRISVRNDQIAMIGKSAMIVTINDRHLQISGNDLTNYLKSIPSENIANIEVISNPPAKYEAEGNSGIVNIRLKTAKANSWNTSFFSSYKQSTYGSGNLGGRFTYQKNKLTVLSSISYMGGSDGSLEKETIHYPDKTFHAEKNGRNFQNAWNGQFGIDYQLNKKITMGAQYSGSFSKPETESGNIATINDLNSNLLQTLETDLQKQLKNNYNTLNFHTIYNFDASGKKLTLDADYFNYGKDQNQTYVSGNYDANHTFIADSYSSLNNIGQQNIENYSLKIDMQHPLEGLKLNYGGKISSTNTGNDLAFYDLSSGAPEYDVSQSNEFRYTENNQSLYLSAEKNFGEKWDVQLGLRLENTQTEGNSLTLREVYDNHYAQLFPTAYLAYTLNDDHSFSLDYGKRILRPRFSMLNPFRTYSGPYWYVEGNPYLEPSFTHNIEAGYTFKNNLNVSLYYSRETNGYGLLTMVDTNSILQINKTLNYYTTDDYGTNISYTFDKFEWLESYISGDVNYSATHTDHPGAAEKTEGWGGSVSVSNSFVFNAAKTFLGSLDLSYSFPNTYIDTKNKASFSTSVGFRYLMNKKLTFNLSFGDIFKTNTQQWSLTSNGMSVNRYNYSDARRVTLSVSWRFGNNKINVRDPKTGNAEEKGRAK